MVIAHSQQLKALALLCPVMTKEKFGEHTGMREGQVKGQIESNNLKTIKIGKHRMINLAAYVWTDEALLIVPFMTPEKFSEASGLREQQVISQLDNNNLPEFKVGRLKTVDLVELTRICMDEEQQEQQEQQAA